MVVEGLVPIVVVEDFVARLDDSGIPVRCFMDKEREGRVVEVRGGATIILGAGKLEKRSSKLRNLV